MINFSEDILNQRPSKLLVKWVYFNCTWSNFNRTWGNFNHTWSNFDRPNIIANVLIIVNK